MNTNGAGILIRNKSGEVLVIHRKEFVPEGGKWGIPGGKINEGEIPIEVAKRKTAEEVGLFFNNEEMVHLSEFSYVAEGNNITFNTWLVELHSDDDPKISLNPAGHDMYKWEKPQDLKKESNLMVGLYLILDKYINTL